MIFELHIQNFYEYFLWYVLQRCCSAHDIFELASHFTYRLLRCCEREGGVNFLKSFPRSALAQCQTQPTCLLVISRIVLITLYNFSRVYGGCCWIFTAFALLRPLILFKLYNCAIVCHDISLNQLSGGIQIMVFSFEAMLTEIPCSNSMLDMESLFFFISNPDDRGFFYERQY